MATIVVVGAALSTLPALGAPSAYAATSKNLVRNGTAERGAGSTTGGVVPVPGWADKTGASFTVVQYGAGGGYPSATDPGPKNRGKNFFAGGPSDPSDSIAATQTDALKPYTTAIAGGGVGFELSAFLGGYGSQGDAATVEIDFLDKHQLVLSTSTIGPVTPAARKNLTGLLKRSAAGSVPVGSVKVLVLLTLHRAEGAYNDAYADNLSLTLTGI
jgi:hypothetical protein